MVLRITIDIFSGRENPMIELPEQETDQIIKRLTPTQRIHEGEEIHPPAPILGYRGLVIEQVGRERKEIPTRLRYLNGNLYGGGLFHQAADETFEEFVCGSTGPLTNLEQGEDLAKFVLEEIDSSKRIQAKLSPDVKLLFERRFSPWWPWRWWWCCRWWCRCRCAPVYEPIWWNDSGQIQYNNNCYNYATNYRTDTYAQPGEATNNKWTDLSGCTVANTEISAKEGAISDCLIDAPAANNHCPSEGHLVALVIRPGNSWSWDYHWYRKGRNRYWSHKMGGSPVTNLDNAGNAIIDPRTADRGAYTEFCTFMIVKHGHIKIT